MSTTPGSSHGARRGRIGRPRNRPPPPPRENPRQIVPRPQTGDDQPQPRQRSPTGATGQTGIPRAPGLHTQTSADNLHSERQSRRSGRARAPRPLNQNLRDDELEVDVSFLDYEGNWVTLPGLMSPHWGGSWIFPETVEALNYQPSTRTESHISVTPRGSNRDDRAVALYMEVKEMIPEAWYLFPVFDKRGLGVSVVLGKPFISAWYGPNNWPSRDGPLSVNQVATMAPDMDFATWNYNDYNIEYQGGMTTSDDSNVQQPQGMEYGTINYDLTAVGAGIPNGYAEFLPEVSNNTDGYVDGYADGYPQES